MSDKQAGGDFIVPPGYPWPPMVYTSDSYMTIPRISIVTPWKDHLELIAEYERAVQGAEVIVVDTSSRRVEGIAERYAMCKRLGGSLATWHREDHQFSFAAACNYGLKLAHGNIVMFLNNDIIAVPGWLDAVRRDVKPGALYAVGTDIRVVNGQPILYLEGWCIAATIETWQNLGGWDAETFQRPYWEDVDLSWRATQLGIRLLRRPWMVTHLGNRTSATTPGAYDHSDANRQAFERKVRAARMVTA